MYLHILSDQDHQTNKTGSTQMGLGDLGDPKYTHPRIGARVCLGSGSCVISFVYYAMLPPVVCVIKKKDFKRK